MGLYEMIFRSLNHFKFVTTRRFFIEPADQNYILARWMLINGFYPEYFWQSSQAVEKYLKAGIAVNNIPASRNHDLLKLYKEHIRIYKELAFRNFQKPEEMRADIWRDESVERFVSRIDHMGNPNTRYGLISWWREPDDLFKLDQLCWNLRRLSIGIDWIVGQDFSIRDDVESHKGSTYRAALTSEPDLLPRGGIDDLSKSVFHTGETRGEILHCWNFEFRGAAAHRSKPPVSGLVPRIGPLANSLLSLYWDFLSAVDDAGAPKAIHPIFLAGMRWLINHIQIERQARKAIVASLELERPVWIPTAESAA